jgi:surface carbohydrate biosynthesis protein
VRTIAIPIETKVRELYGKLWLSTHLVERGWRVVLGRAPALNDGLDLVEPDVYLGDSAAYRENRLTLYETVQQSGGSVGVLDTEGGIYMSDDDYAKRLSTDVLDHVDAFYAWGSDPARILTDRMDFPADNVFVTGNPRFDLLQPSYRGIYEDEATAHRSTLDQYVLFNMNLAVANHFDPEILESSGFHEIQDRYRYETKLLASYIRLIATASERLSDMTFIVRPHPSENFSTYQRAFRAHENVVVRHEGDVQPWILGARAVVHSNCTTGVESVLLDTPTFAFLPVQASKYEMPLPNAVSERIETVDTCIDRLDTLSQDETTTQLSSVTRERIEPYIANVSSTAAPQIAGRLDALVSSECSPDVFDATARQRLERAFTRWGTAHVVDSLRSSNPYREYANQKFSGLSADEITQILGRLRDYADIGEPALEPIPSLEDVFVLSPHDTA